MLHRFEIITRRRPRGRSATPVLAIVLGLAAHSSAVHGAEPITGRARVVDGNTVEIEGRRVRLRGIDAPDVDQICQDGQRRDYACGRRAAAALATRIGNETVTCQPEVGGEAGGRHGTCRIGDADLNAWMVVRGYAVAERGPGAAYTREDGRAWGRREGLWAGTFQEPAEWRQARRTRTAQTGS